MTVAFPPRDTASPASVVTKGEHRLPDADALTGTFGGKVLRITLSATYKSDSNREEIHATSFSPLYRLTLCRRLTLYRASTSGKRCTPFVMTDTGEAVSRGVNAPVVKGLKKVSSLLSTPTGAKKELSFFIRKETRWQPWIAWHVNRYM